MEWNLWEAIIRIIVCLPIVVILAFLLIKYGFSKNYLKNRGDLKIIEQVALLPKATINIVKAGDEYLLVSATEQEVIVVKKLDNYQEKETHEFQFYLNDKIKRFTRESGNHE